MLKFFRNKNVAKMVLWGLLILILPAFVLWGTGSLTGSKNKGPKYAGIINKKKVSFGELYENIAAMRTLLVINYSNQPKILDTFLKNKPLVAKLAWDRLVMLKEAGRHKIKVPDSDVVNYIRGHPLFSRNGGFDDKLYGYVLQYNFGLSPRSFEEMVRDNLKIQRLNEIITKDVKVTNEEVLKEYKKANEKSKETEAKTIDEEKFKKEKDEFAKRLLERKKALVIDEWFRGISIKASLAIDLNEIEKYYR